MPQRVLTGFLKMLETSNRKTYKAGIFTYVKVMKVAVTLKRLYKEIEDVKTELHLIRYIMEEDYELSEEAKRKLEIARKTSRSEYIRHEEIMAKYG